MLRLAVLICGALLGGQALAAPFTVAYEGNDCPENEGWLRETTGGGAERTLEEGVLVLDGRARRSITDYYQITPPVISLDPGESLHVQFRFALEDLDSSGPGDATIAINTGQGPLVALRWSSDSIVSIHEDRMVDFTISGFVAFELITANLESFDLFADGSLIYSGQFVRRITTTPRIAWGDSVQGAASLTRWDYMRIIVVPEPASWVCALLLLGGAQVRRRKCVAVWPWRA